MFLPFGEYTPDSAPLNQAGTPFVLNVIPGSTGDYLPLPSLSEFSVPIPDFLRVRGVRGVRLSDGTNAIYVGTAQNLWQGSGQGWTWRGGIYTLSANEQWSFTQWRNYIFATHYEGPVQWSVINGAGFGSVITSLRAPRARHIALVNRDFIVLGNTFDSVDGDRPTRVWWSARADPRNFNPDITTQAGFEDLDADDGAVQGIVGSEYGTIVMQKGIWRMTYEGGEVIFRFDKVIRNKGCISPGSIASFGRTVYFWDEDGPYAFDGTQAQPIGDGKIASTAINQLNQESRAWISCAIIPRQTVVLWAIPTNSPLADKLYIYNWKTGRWSYAEVEVETLFSTYTAPMLLDQPDITGLLTDVVPQANWSIDAEQFMGGVPVLGAFTPDHKMNFFNGPPMLAIVDTAEVAPFNDRRAAVRSVRPIVDRAGAMVIGLYHRDLLTESPAITQASFLNMTGAANIWVQGRYLRIRTYISGGFTHAIGVETDFIREGVR